jgi:hypothetical protein
MSPIVTAASRRRCRRIRRRVRRAAARGNRGPIRFDARGRVASDTLDAYWRCGSIRKNRWHPASHVKRRVARDLPAASTKDA